jgi:alanine dehydrogenase
VALADKGWQKALKANPHLKNGLNVCLGHVTTKRWRMVLAIPMWTRTACWAERIERN